MIAKRVIPCLDVHAGQVTRGVQFIHNLRTSAGSHERLAVVELFGRYSGETSLITAYLAGVDRAVISEVPFDPERRVVTGDPVTVVRGVAMDSLFGHVQVAV